MALASCTKIAIQSPLTPATTAVWPPLNWPPPSASSSPPWARITVPGGNPSMVSLGALAEVLAKRAAALVLSALSSPRSEFVCTPRAPLFSSSPSALPCEAAMLALMVEALVVMALALDTPRLVALEGLHRLSSMAATRLACSPTSSSPRPRLRLTSSFPRKPSSAGFSSSGASFSCFFRWIFSVTSWINFFGQ